MTRTETDAPVARRAPARRMAGVAGWFARVAGASLCVMCLLSSVADPQVPVSVRLLLLALAGLTAWRPAVALVALAGLLPLSEPVGRVLGARAVTLAEAFVLAFLLGWLIAPIRDALHRRAEARAQVPRVPEALDWPAIAMSSVALASAVVWLSGTQARTDAWLPFYADLAETIRTGWLRGQSSSPLGAALRLVEALALLTIAARVSRERPDAAWNVVRVSVVAAAVAGVLSFTALAHVWGMEIAPRDMPYLFPSGFRLSAHVGDIHAAGSHFALALLAALGLALGRRGWTRLPWIAAGCTIAGGLCISGSRTALACLLLAVVGSSIAAALRRFARWRVLSVVALAIVVGLVAFRYDPRGVTTEVSVGSRMGFLRATLDMWNTAPWFGVGVGSYYERSAAFMPPDLRRRLPARVTNEHAHNYYLEVAAELGVLGGLTFLFVLAVAGKSLVRAAREAGHEWPVTGLVAGLTAFLLTAVAGHPFLVLPVAFAFWLLLGAAVSLATPLGSASLGTPPGSATDVHTRRPAGLASRFPPWQVISAGVVLLVAVTLPVRVRGVIDEIDFTKITYGMHGWEQDESGTPFRWTRRERATLFVEGSTTRVEIPLRTFARPGGPQVTAVEIEVDGRHARQLRLADAGWFRLYLDLRPSTRRFRRIDLVVDDVWSPSDAGSQDDRTLGIKVGRHVVLLTSPAAASLREPS